MKKDLIEIYNWFYKNPFNLYECEICGQHYKANCDPIKVLKDFCFRCGGSWVIREGHEIRYPSEYKEKNETSKEENNCA